MSFAPAAVGSTPEDLFSMRPTRLSESHTKGSEEVWYLCNWTPEDHNFHIHQSRFTVLDGGWQQGSVAMAARTLNSQSVRDVTSAAKRYEVSAQAMTYRLMNIYSLDRKRLI